MRSTPFGIKGTFTPFIAYPWDPLDQVLNAFRHQRYFHRTSGASSGRALKVLNAFRHQRYFHHARRLACRTLAGLCSTPFGIKGTFTRWMNSHLRKPTDVLNAFRHQRYFHEYKTVNHVRAERVLNAFRHQRYFHSRQIQATSPVGSRAQRLSASKVLSRASSGRACPPACNQCSTPFGIKGTFTGSRGPAQLRGQVVLNAFRHQRYFHMKRAGILTEGFECSTPFGIKGTFTSLGALNDCITRQCSTPFGIKGTFTRTKGTWAGPGRCAQRLSASKVLSPRSPGSPRL